MDREGFAWVRDVGSEEVGEGVLEIRWALGLGLGH